MKKLLVVMIGVMAITSLMVIPAFSADKLIVKDSTPAANTVFVVQDTGNTGIGTAGPVYQLETANEGTNSTIGIRVASGTTTGVPVFFGLRAGGTLATPAATPLGSGLFWLGGKGWTPSNTWNSNLTGLMGFNAAETFSDASNGTYFFISTTPIGSTARVERFRIADSGFVGIGTSSPQALLDVAGTIRYQSLAQGSSREYKDNIEQLSASKAATTLEDLQPVTFTYKNDPSTTHLGFIAEDVPAVVATDDRKGVRVTEIVAVLTKVIQEQNKTITELSEKLNKLEAQFTRIKSKDMLGSVDPSLISGN